MSEYGREQKLFASIERCAIIPIKEGFEQNDISMLFLIRTLDFGKKGGKTLADMGVSYSNRKRWRAKKLKKI